MEHLNPEIHVPDHCDHLLEWFWELHSARGQGVAGPNPISFTEIATWASLTGTIVRREEIAIIRSMDAAFLSAIAIERQEAETAAAAKE